MIKTKLNTLIGFSLLAILDIYGIYGLLELRIGVNMGLMDYINQFSIFTLMMMFFGFWGLVLTFTILIVTIPTIILCSDFFNQEITLKK